MARPRLTPEQKAVSIARRRERLKLRDRRKEVICSVCSVSFKMPKGHKKPSLWCDSCRFISLQCQTCNRDFQVHRRFFNHRGAKYCSKECTPAISRFLIDIKPEEHPCYKHGLCADRLSYTRLHRKQNRDKYRFYALHRHALKRGAEGTYSFEEWVSLKERFDNTCLCCLRKEPEIRLTADHIVPLSKGGSNKIENIQPLCGSCNSKKHTKEINYINNLYDIR